MDNERGDCTWCGSAASIEYGICQVCLMEYPLETQVIRLPLEARQGRRVTLDLSESEVGIAE